MWDARETIRAIAWDLDRGVEVAVIAARFHHGVAALIEAACLLLRDQHGLATVALSGGVFQNQLLLHAAVTKPAVTSGFRFLFRRGVRCRSGSGRCGAGDREVPGATREIQRPKN